MSAFSIQDTTFVQKGEEEKPTTFVDVESPRYGNLQPVCNFLKNLQGNTRKK